jgi:hypothetical protein
VSLAQRGQVADSVQFEGLMKKTRLPAVLMLIAGALGATFSAIYNPIDDYDRKCGTYEVVQCRFHKKGDAQTLKAMHTQFNTLQKDLATYQSADYSTQEIMASIPPLAQLTDSEKQTVLDIAKTITSSDGLDKALAGYNQFADKVLVNHSTPEQIAHSKQLMKELMQTSQGYLTARNVFIALLVVGVLLAFASVPPPSPTYSFYKDYLSRGYGLTGLADTLFPDHTTY